MALYPQSHTSQVTPQYQETNLKNSQVTPDYVLSYDEILQLLDNIESGEYEKNCTPEQLESITHFIALLAKEGVLPDNSPESLSLEDDIEELLNGKDNRYEHTCSFLNSGEYQYIIVPAVSYGKGDLVFCKGWVHKQWKHVKKFAKKHRKALIIGAAVVVAAAVVVVTVVTASSAATAGIAAAAGASDIDYNHKKHEKEAAGSSSSASTEVISGIMTTQEAPALRSALNDQASSFKENIVCQKFFQNTNPSIQNYELSWEENARALGSLFAHDCYKNLLNQIPHHPRLGEEVEYINSKYTFQIRDGYQEHSNGHSEIDRKFFTDYSSHYSNQTQEVDFKTLSYQLRGEKASALGYYNQAVQDLGNAIELNPTNAIPYLERGVAHFALGEYDHSLEDYKQYIEQVEKTNPLSVSEFSLGFAKGLPKGVYESGEGLVQFVSDLLTHPIHTGKQIWDTLSLLGNLAQSEQWDVISQAIVPEVHQLIKEWDTLLSDKRGELAGYAFGKYGADIVIPGALSKAVSTSMKGIQELSIVYKGLQNAEKTLILESVSSLENGKKIAEVIKNKTAIIAEKLGFNPHEVAQLENIGKIHGQISNVAKDTRIIAQDINFANHALQRAVERGVSRESILDALASPLKVEEVKLDKLGRPSQRFVGQKAEVVINPETQQVVSVNPTSTKKFEKLSNELSNVNDKVE